MKKFLKPALFASLLIAAFAVASFAQEPEKIALKNGKATLTGETGSRLRFAFDIKEGQRVKITLTSTDSKARFVLQNGAEDDTGTTGWDSLTTFDKVLDSAYWEIGISGTSSTTYTLSITVTDE